MKAMLKRHKHEFILAILICIYIAYFTVATFLRYDNFYAGRFDLGNMDQTVWNTINGRIFQTSNENGIIGSRLSAHADFLLILISPLYFLWSNPKILLLLQTIVLGMGSIFVYLIAKEVLRNKNLALIFSFLFLMNPLVQFTNLYDFHAVTLATTFLLAAFYFLIKQKYSLLVLFLMLAGITKEQVWIITAIFGFFLLFKKSGKIKFLGLSIMLISLGLFYYLVSVAIPQNLGGQHFALAYYSDFGDSPIKIVKNILLSPQKTISIIFELSHLDYLKNLFIPLGFLPLLSPLYLLFTIPDLLKNLLSNNSQLYQIYYQYTANITPFIFISSIFAVKNIAKWFPKITPIHISMYLLIFTFSSSYLLGPLPGAKNPSIDMFTKPYSDKKIIEDFLARIPENYTVAATNNLGAHLSHRKSVATIPAGTNKAQIILFLLNDVSAQPSLASQKKIANNLKQDKNYVKVFEKDDFIVFRNRGTLL